MENHNTHILSDGTSSGNFYKYDKFGKLIIDSIDDINNNETKKEIKESESILENNKLFYKQIFMNNYDKDLDTDDLDLIKMERKKDKKINKINIENKNDEIKDELNVININENVNSLINKNLITFLTKKK